MDLQLQPLRIPEGWIVDYNSLHEIDPDSLTLPSNERECLFKEDLLQMRHPNTNRLLDVGWYPERDLATGQFRLVVFEGDFHGRLLSDFRTRSRPTLVAEIEKVLLQTSSL